MKSIGDVLKRDPDKVLSRPYEFAADQQSEVAYFERSDIPIHLTRQEWGAVGRREITVNDRRIIQTALCTDPVTGEVLYPMPRQPNETAGQMLERNAQDRAAMKRCEKPSQQQPRRQVREFD
jgi:hypothetical protein